MYRTPMPGHPFGILFGIAGFVGTLLVIALIVALVVYLVRRNKPGTPQYPAQPTVPTGALQVLDHRLATGEIDIDDYRTRRAALLGEPPAAPPTPPED